MTKQNSLFLTFTVKTEVFTSKHSGPKTMNCTIPGPNTKDCTIPGLKTNDYTIPGPKTNDYTIPGHKTKDYTIPGLKTNDYTIPGHKTKDYTIPGPNTKDGTIPGPKTKDCTITVLFCIHFWSKYDGEVLLLIRNILHVKPCMASSTHTHQVENKHGHHKARSKVLECTELFLYCS